MGLHMTGNDWKYFRKMVKYGLGWIETVDNDVKQLVENVWNFLKTVQNRAIWPKKGWNSWKSC